MNCKNIFDIHLDRQGTEYKPGVFAVEENWSSLAFCILLPYSASARVRALIARDIISTEMLFTLGERCNEALKRYFPSFILCLVMFAHHSTRY